MEEFDRRCDLDGMEAYLETIRWADPAKPSHERFYGRLGYAVADVIPMTDEWSVLTMRPGRERAAGRLSPRLVAAGSSARSLCRALA